MKTTSLLAALGLLATALAVLPSSQAMQLPPPCQTASMTTCCPMEPSFAPCCTLLSCPPPIARCPDADVETTDYLLLAGPYADVETDSDCSANGCLNTNDCSDSNCRSGDDTCCSLSGTMSYCSNVQPCDGAALAASSAAMALPIPHVSYVLHPDCTVTVYETYDCPNGFWDTQSHLRQGPVDAYVDSCTIQCACMPIEIALAE